jgi:acetyl esterase/lipase
MITQRSKHVVALTFAGLSVMAATLFTDVAFSQGVTLPPPPQSLSEQARATLSAIASAPSQPAMPLAQMRAFSDQYQLAHSAKQKAKYAVTIKDDVIAGVPVRIIASAAQAPDPLRIFLDLHGGGFEVDSGSLTENIPIAALTGISVVAVRYRLAPENPFPAAVNDALTVYRELLKAHRPQNIAVYGTSAGAILGPELIMRIISEGLPVPAALGVFSGDADFARVGDSARLFPLPASQDYAAVVKAYVGSTRLTDPLLSPIYGNLKGFPPTLCMASGRDVLLSGTVDFCRQLDHFDVPTHLVVFDALPHAFWAYLDIPESDEAFNTMAKFFLRQLGAVKLVATASDDSSARCAALAQLSLPDSTITAARAVDAGPFKSANVPIEIKLPAHCRIEGRIAPEPGSDIRFEVWLPLSGWNDRLYGAGNGGFGGDISYVPGLAGAIQRGAVGLSTDTGHTGGAEDGSWAKGQLARLKDYGYRAVHLSTVNAKAIAAAFYGHPPAKAYFTSCSNGGRQGLMEAQRYPEDYDGIIAGAPALDWTGVAADFIWNTRALHAQGASIPTSKLPALQAAVRRACGAGDHFVNDPRACKFDPRSLSCASGDADSCLTAPQVAALRKIYAGPSTSKGVSLYPGFSASGAEIGTPPGSGWDGWILAPPGRGSNQEKYPREMLANFTTTLATDIERFDFDRDYPVFKSELAPIINATEADLHRFAEHGGKLILWHGWADPALPPLRTVEYFERVRSLMGAENADNMVRLFMVPGVQHCLGGPGPNSFGQFGASTHSANPEEDLSLALERWVETGSAPKDLLARHADNPFVAALDSIVPATGETELICAYPKIATRSHGALECTRR